MSGLYTLIAILFVVAIIISFARVYFEGGAKKEKAKYHYTRKNFFLTRAEHECYDALIQAVGEKYHVFAQVHLSTILDHKVKGQSWKAAFSHISQKSVDFVLCDKAYISPKLAIELDDSTHQRTDRQKRDAEVERILSEAGVPLLRLQNHERNNLEVLVRKIREHALE